MKLLAYFLPFRTSARNSLFFQHWRNALPFRTPRNTLSLAQRSTYRGPFRTVPNPSEQRRSERSEPLTKIYWRNTSGGAEHLSVIPSPEPPRCAVSSERFSKIAHVRARPRNSYILSIVKGQNGHSQLQDIHFVGIKLEHRSLKPMSEGS